MLAPYEVGRIARKCHYVKRIAQPNIVQDDPGPLADEEEREGRDDILAHAPPVVGRGEEAAVEPPADGHHRRFAGQPRPGRPEVAPAGNHQPPEAEHRHEARPRDDDGQRGALLALVPEREVEPDARQHVGPQHDGQDVDALAEVTPHNQREEVAEEGDAQEDEHRGHDVVLERRGVHGDELRLAEVREEEGLGRQAVHLVEEHHHHGNLGDGAVDAQLGHRPLGDEVLDELAVDELVGRAGQSAHQQRQRVGEDGRQQAAVDARKDAVGGEEDDAPGHHAGREVGHEDPPHAELRGEEPRHAEGEGQGDVEHHVERLDGHEGHGAPLFAQPREGDAGRDVEEDDEPHPDDVVGMGGVGRAHGGGDALAEEQDEGEEEHGGQRGGAPRGGEEPALGALYVAAGLLGLGREAEVARLHAHRQEGEGQRDEGVDIGDDAVGLLPEDACIVGREQVAQEPHHDGADAVDGGLFSQFFEHDADTSVQIYEKARAKGHACARFLPVGRPYFAKIAILSGIRAASALLSLKEGGAEGAPWRGR